jgi:protein-S-isoprenylcysteine O-methyltransferase Ste14
MWRGFALLAQNVVQGGFQGLVVRYMSSQLTKLNGDFGREKCRDPVTVVPEHPVIEAGPYRLIRHPSSTGLLIMFLGFGLSSTNWLSLLALMGCALLGFSYRIHVEEHVLQEHLGLRYQEYMRRTKRLIPFVL